jgi:hypothetical protein
MNNQPLDIEGIFTRIERLEKENKRLKRISIAILLIGSVVVLMAQVKAPVQQQLDAGWEKRVVKAGTIQAGRIELITPKGELRAALGTVFGGSELNMFDGDGKARISLSTQAGPGLYVGSLRVTDGHFDWLHSGKLNVQLTSENLTLASDTGQRAMLAPQVFLIEDRKQRIAMGVSTPDVGSPAGFAFVNVLADEASVRVGRTDSYYTQIGTTELVTPTSGESHKTSPASLVLFNDKGSAIWRAP